MKDLETKVTRMHEMRNNELVVIRRHEGENGDKRKVIVTTEEFGMTLADAESVLNTTYPREIAKVDEERSKLEKQISELDEKVKTFESDGEFVKFKKMIDDPNTKLLFDQLSMVTDLGRLKRQLENNDKVRADLAEWRKQFEGIKETLTKQ